MGKLLRLPFFLFLVSIFIICEKLNAQEFINQMLKLKLGHQYDYEHLIFDYNGDLKVDVLVYAKSRDSIDFYRNAGSEMIYDFSIKVHAFSNSYFHPYYGNEIHFYYQDADKDGFNDLLVYSANHWDCSNNTVRIYWGNALTWFNSDDFLELPIDAPYCVGSVFVDFDNDGQTDVFIRSASGLNTMLRNEGNRVFSQVQTFATGRDISMFFSDMDEDGIKDLIYGKNGWADGQWGFRFNKGLGDGAFDPSTQVYFQDERVSDWNVVSISLNPVEDDVLDFAFLANNDGTNQRRLYKAFWDNSADSFTFSTHLLEHEGVDTELISPVDYNGDGYTDLVYRFRHNQEPPFRYTGCVLLNDGYGNFYKTDTLIKDSYYKPYFFRPDPDHRFYMGLLKDKGTSNFWEIDSIFIVRIDDYYSVSDSISVSDELVSVDEEAKVEIVNHVDLKALDKIKNFACDISFDPAIVQFADYGMEGSIANKGLVSVEILMAEAGNLKVIYSSDSVLTGSGTLINLHFKAIESGKTEIKASNFHYNNDTINKVKSGSIEVLHHEVSLFIPSAFTPNNDGINDFFEIIAEGIEHYEVWIKDAWGQTIFSFDQSSGKWSGETDTGDEAPAGAYYYGLIAKDRTGAELFRHGIVYLIREMIDLSPNPAEDKLKVKLHGWLPGERMIRIFKADGVMANDHIFSDLDEITFDVSGLKNGFYILVINNGIECRSVSFLKQ